MGAAKPIANSWQRWGFDVVCERHHLWEEHQKLISSLPSLSLFTLLLKSAHRRRNTLLFHFAWKKESRETTSAATRNKKSRYGRDMKRRLHLINKNSPVPSPSPKI